ncbi:MAG: non-canonical purine NTP pyrophosphatase [Planctomycetales bacterium]|nr:non-canonical purine NTP pyrophosphatase [Planctomycetales bacterium]
MIVVLGTHNVKKARELHALLEPHRIEVRTLADYPHAIEVVEDGNSFADNARLKATQQAQHLGMWVIGEDSGICVDALQGAPGIYSARFSGPDATDLRNNEELLRQLRDVPAEKRGAHYVCHLTLADPHGKIQAECEEMCRGCIRFAPAGDAGFGYDPLFEILELHRTFGELGPMIKGLLSHRGRAMRQFVRPLLSALGAD